MIKLIIEPYCHDCEYFEPVMAKKYEIGKGYIETEITCKETENCEYAKNLCEKIEKQNKDLDDFVNKVIKDEIKEADA